MPRDEGDLWANCSDCQTVSRLNSHRLIQHRTGLSCLVGGVNWALYLCDVLRSSSSTALVISWTVRATIGHRAFSAAATSVWNSLPEAVCSSASVALFRKSLKTELFTRSYVG